MMKQRSKWLSKPVKKGDYLAMIDYGDPDSTHPFAGIDHIKRRKNGLYRNHRIFERICHENIIVDERKSGQRKYPQRTRRKYLSSIFND